MKDWVMIIFFKVFLIFLRVFFDDRVNFFFDKFFFRKIYFFKIRYNVSFGKILLYFCSFVVLKICRGEFDESLIVYEYVRVFFE